MLETIEYKNPAIDKSKWGAGPWQDEPDKKQWQDPATGLACLVVRNRMGALCGYVGVPKSHACYGKGYDAVDVDAHGGLTFADKCSQGREECDGICHKAPEGEDDVWWFGFDCAHACDFIPSMHELRADMGRTNDYWCDETYRDFEYVTHRVTSLATQLAAL